MSEEDIARARAGLPEWARQSHRNFEALVRVLNAPAEQSAEDPLTLLPYLQRYVSMLPLDQFEQSDWVTLHSDLASFVAEVMVKKHRGQWAVREAPNAPRGFRYVIEVGGGMVDPFEVVAHELRARPIEVTRMIASAELTAGVTRPYD